MTESTVAQMAGDQVLALEVEKQAIMLVGWECAHNAELVAQWNRITGNDLLGATQLSKKNNKVAEQWAAFVLDCVWERLPLEAQDYYRRLALAAVIEQDSPNVLPPHHARRDLLS